MALEEGTWAALLYDVLKAARCRDGGNSRRNALLKEGSNAPKGLPYPRLASTSCPARPRRENTYRRRPGFTIITWDESSVFEALKSLLANWEICIV